MKQDERRVPWAMTLLGVVVTAGACVACSPARRGPGHGPALNVAWTNSLDMTFVPVPGTAVLFSRWETRVRDYQVFVTETRRPWPRTTLIQTPDHPAVNVTWDDARDFCDWLTRKERKSGFLGSDRVYRLPTDEEWSIAVGLDEPRAGLPRNKDGVNTEIYPWGRDWPPPPGAGNYAAELKVDSYDGTAPVGSFAPNQFGVCDLGGNCWEWCEDCYDAGRTTRVLRGGAWNTVSQRNLLAARRFRGPTNAHHDRNGFRVVVGAVAPSPK